MKKVHIYDMDGTIVCSLHRYKTIDNKIDLKHWRDNSHKAYSDSLLPLAEQYKKDLQNDEIFVIIATARVLGEPDMRFINDKLGLPDHIVSRKGNFDNRSGVDLKVTGIKQILLLKQFNDVILHFWEDNKAYLKGVCDSLGAVGHFVKSKQGH